MIIQPTKANMGFDSKLVNAQAILVRLSYVLLGGLITSGLFLVVQEIPNPVFVFLTAITMISIDVYLEFTSKNVTDSGDNVTDSDDSITDPNGGDDK